MTADDSTLLLRYADDHDETAFAELVQRYLNLVYFAALRQVSNDSHSAEDVTQTVFTQLARKAKSLVQHPSLAGWLHTTTRFVASETTRAERRRFVREQEAYSMDNLSNDPDGTANWEQLRPVIDDTLNKLSKSDREVVLLRFFANLPHTEIGQKLNLSENTARMRVDRALEKLRGLLAKRGVTSTAAALSTALANQALASAPAGLAASTTSLALAGAAKTAAAITTTAITGKIISIMSTTKIIAGTAGIISVAATFLTWHQWQSNAELNSEVSALRKQTAALQSENQQLAAKQKSIDENTRAEHAELMQLHANKGIILNQSSDTTTAEQKNKNVNASGSVSARTAPTEMMSVDLAAKKAGRETPTNTARTLLWYLQGGDVKHAAELLAFEPPEKEKLKDFIDTLPKDLQDEYGTPSKLIAFVMSGSPKPLANVQLISETQPDDYTTVQHVKLEYKNGEVREDDLKFHRDVDGWKQVVSPASVDRVITYLKRKQT